LPGDYSESGDRRRREPTRRVAAQKASRAPGLAGLDCRRDRGICLAVPGEPKRQLLLSQVGAIERLRRMRPSPRGRSGGAGANVLPS
jgi:hypothetical protein